MPPKPPKPPKKSHLKKSQTCNQGVPSLTIRSVNTKYFYISTEDINLSSLYQIAANKFSDDSGNPVTGFPTKKQNNYINLSINGVLQADQLFTLTNSSVTLRNVGGMINKGTPIILEIVEFYLK